MTSSFSLTNQCKPFLRWAGGKNWLVKSIPDYLNNISYGDYYEPFVGGASTFFFLHPTKAYLSDINEDLIETYKSVASDVESIIKIIGSWSVNSDQYYKIRSLKPSSPSEQAARFIYLNRTSFNGIYRVNQQGEYNVPYGKKDNYQFDFNRIRDASRALKSANLDTMGYADAMKRAKHGDLVFLDPPYTVAHNNNGFIEYNKNLFSLDDQKKLRACIDDLKERGVYFILTNAAHDTVKDIFKSCGQMKEVSRYSGLGGRNAKRQTISECIFTNIPNAFQGEQ